MRKILFGIVVILFTLPVIGQIKVVSFKKLQQYLPAVELPGYLRSKPVGQTQTTMGISMSEASVKYNQQPAENETTPAVEISIKIQDVSFMPAILTQYMMMQQNSESENENGYEKWYRYKDKYAGKLNVVTGDGKSCKIELAVGNRFLISTEAYNTDDLKLLEKLIDSMDLEKLISEQP